MAETALERAWSADAYAKRVHTYEAWMIAADAFEEAGRLDIARRLREEAKPLRTNLSRRELLHIAVRAAENAMTGRKRPSEKLFMKARIAAFNAIRRADRLAGTERHRSVRNAGQIENIAARGVTLARRLYWGGGHLPEWEQRVGRDLRYRGADGADR